MWTYMFMNLTSHLSSKTPEINSVSGADRTNPKLFLSLVRYKILPQLFGMLVDTIFRIDVVSTTGESSDRQEVCLLEAEL